jgi:hypothetical protein
VGYGAKPHESEAKRYSWICELLQVQPSQAPARRCAAAAALVLKIGQLTLLGCYGAFGYNAQKNGGLKPASSAPR